MTRHSVRPLAWLALLLGIGGAWAGDPPKAKPADQELERLRGRWRLTACTFDGDEFPADLLKKVKVTVKGRTLTVTPGPSVHEDGQSGKKTFRLGNEDGDATFEAELELDPPPSRRRSICGSTCTAGRPGTRASTSWSRGSSPSASAGRSGRRSTSRGPEPSAACSSSSGGRSDPPPRDVPAEPKATAAPRRGPLVE